MIEEMQAKFSRLSQSLIEGLEEREELVQEREVRHKFIAAVHQLVQHRENLSPSLGGGTNLTVKELRRLASNRRSKEKSPVKVSCSDLPLPVRCNCLDVVFLVCVSLLHHTSNVWYRPCVCVCLNALCTFPQYLHTVIPYTARPTRVPWNLDTLEKLTRSMC